MNPNPDIWGAPNTWINAPIMGGQTGTLPESLKISNPKCPDFGTESNSTRLVSGITSGRITANEPLDLSICPCGQDEKVSAYGKLAIFNEDGAVSTTPRVVERTSPVNWFMYDQRLDADRNIEGFKIWKDWDWSVSSGMRYDQWSPNATLNSHNPNLYISPYTFWYIRSLLLSIQVACFNSASASGVNFSWYTLDDWKNNHSDLSICGVRCFTRAVNHYNSSTNVIEYINVGLSQYYYAGKVGLLDPIPDINNNGTIRDTTFFSFLKYGNSGRALYLFMPNSSISQTHAYAILPAWEMFDGQTINRVGNSSYGYVYYYLIPYSDDTYEKIMQMIACFGCYFTPSGNYEFHYAMTSNDLCLPIVDANGITHGKYTRGADNANNSLYSKSSIRDMNYDPYAKHYGTYCKVCGYGGEYKSICPRCHATGDNLLNIPAMAQGPMWKLDPDDPQYGDLYAIDVERDQTTGFTNPNLHRRVSDALEELPNGYLHLPGTHETIDYPDSEYCSVKNFDTDTILDVPTITKYNGSQKYIEMSEVFVDKGYTTIGTGCFTDTDVVYVEIPEGITTIE